MALNDIKDARDNKGYLTCEEVNDLIPHGVHSPDDLDDLLTTIGTQGIDVIEGQLDEADKVMYSAKQAGKNRVAHMVFAGGKQAYKSLDFDEFGSVKVEQ